MITFTFSPAQVEAFASESRSFLKYLVQIAANAGIAAQGKQFQPVYPAVHAAYNAVLQCTNKISAIKELRSRYEANRAEFNGNQIFSHADVFQPNDMTLGLAHAKNIVETWKDIW